MSVGRTWRMYINSILLLNNRVMTNPCIFHLLQLERFALFWSKHVEASCCVLDDGRWSAKYFQVATFHLISLKICCGLWMLTASLNIGKWIPFLTYSLLSYLHRIFCTYVCSRWAGNLYLFLLTPFMIISISPCLKDKICKKYHFFALLLKLCASFWMLA